MTTPSLSFIKSLGSPPWLDFRRKFQLNQCMLTKCYACRATLFNETHLRVISSFCRLKLPICRLKQAQGVSQPPHTPLAPDLLERSSHAHALSLRTGHLPFPFLQYKIVEFIIEFEVQPAMTKISRERGKLPHHIFLLAYYLPYRPMR